VVDHACRFSGGGDVLLELSHEQVVVVMGWAAQSGLLSAVLSGVGDAQVGDLRGLLDDRRLSRSLLVGLVMLAAMPRDGALIGVAELARLTGMNHSTTHRYLSTCRAVGVVERDSETRRYRVAA